MSLRNRLILAAIVLVLSFIGARVVLLRAIEAGEKPREKATLVESKPTNPAQNNTEIERAFAVIEHGLANPSSQTLLQGHRELADLAKAGNFRPKDWAAVASRLTKARQGIGATENPDLQRYDAHMLAVQIDALMWSGTPDPKLTEALKAMKLAHPERFELTIED